jgi:hypothetical protein
MLEDIFGARNGESTLLDLEKQGIILRKKSEREEIEENVERREGIFIQ